jgi:hypothetical protein
MALICMVTRHQLQVSWDFCEIKAMKSVLRPWSEAEVRPAGLRSTNKTLARAMPLIMHFDSALSDIRTRKSKFSANRNPHKLQARDGDMRLSEFIRGKKKVEQSQKAELECPSRLNIDNDLDDEASHEAENLIVVMGVTGAGKSYFINKLKPGSVVEGHGIRSSQ